MTRTNGQIVRHFFRFNFARQFRCDFRFRRLSWRVEFAGSFVPLFLLHHRFVFFAIFIVAIVVFVIHHCHIGEILLIFAEEFGVGSADLSHDQLVTLFITQYLSASSSGLHPLLQLVLQVETKKSLVMMELLGRGRRRRRRKSFG